MDNLICTACGTEFDTADRKALLSCRICDDPRQFVPPSGQSFTTMKEMQKVYTNQFTPIKHKSNLISITTTPKFAIGQRAILIRTPVGNVLWDCITLLDQATCNEINSRGCLVAIVISHPHYYTTHRVWAAAFKCPVHLASEDSAWLTPLDSQHCRMLHASVEKTWSILTKEGEPTGVKILKLGGHFPGSLVALVRGHFNREEALLVADTLVTTPSGLGDWGDQERPAGMNSFAFMWSIPNMIPLTPDKMAAMWDVLKHVEFTSTHGAFIGTDIVAPDVKQRVLESMKIQIRRGGHANHPFLEQ